MATAGLAAVKRYIQCPDTGKLVPRAAYQQKVRRTSWQVMPDIQPYRSMIDGHIVQSRSGHRAHLRINNCIEVGSEVQKPRPVTTPPGLKQTLIDICNDKLR